MKKLISLIFIQTIFLTITYGQITKGDSLEMAFGIQSKLIIDLPQTEIKDSLENFIVKSSDKWKSIYNNSIVMKAGRRYSENFKEEKHFYWIYGKDDFGSPPFMSSKDIEKGLERDLTKTVFFADTNSVKLILFVDKDIIMGNLYDPIYAIKKYKEISKIYVAVRLNSNEDKFEIAMKTIDPTTFTVNPHQYVDDWVQKNFELFPKETIFEVLDYDYISGEDIDYDRSILRPNPVLEAHIKKYKK